MKQSHSYRLAKAEKTKHTKWELTYGVIAARLLRKGNMNTENVFAVAKFLGAFVYVFSFPYSWLQMLRIKRKLKTKTR